ncbi:MAG: S-layer homology domain-containing protein [Clostridiaceae bacterium]|nr:S-layer homology domain-containing protein [Clostridiaceae bacterium]
MKKLLIVLLAVVLAVQGSVFISFAGLDDELAVLRKSIRSIKDIDNEKYARLEDVIVRKFSDAKKGDWYMSVMTKLVGLSSIDGTDKGTLDPMGTVTRAMFIKMFIRAMYNPEILIDVVPDFDHWAARDVKKAEELGFLAAREYTLKNIAEPITRGEMAKIIVRAYNKSEKNRVTLEDCQQLISKIKDYAQIPKDFQPYVLVAYGSGIISGYSDGRFGANDYATRAQAAAFIIRYLDPSERAKVEGVKKEEPKQTREPTVLRWDDPYRPLPMKEIPL